MQDAEQSVLQIQCWASKQLPLAAGPALHLERCTRRLFALPCCAAACCRFEAGPAVLYHWTSFTPLLLQVVTVNDYLARRDSEWVGQVHKFLGLQVGLIQQGISVSAFRPAWPDLPGIGSLSAHASYSIC